ncbi:MAG: flagellar protein export ATPase FliI [Elusimicrobiales bacterium]|nr:flagellar protein export ATPase FliI [Elusimicrobiales bacterium]
MIDLEKEIIKEIEKIETCPYVGNINKVIGLVIEVKGIIAAIGEICKIETEKGIFLSEVVGFSEDKTFLMPLNDLYDLKPGARVYTTSKRASVKVGKNLIGRVIDALGNPIDDKGVIVNSESYPLYTSPPKPMTRKRITEPLETGIKVIDGLTTIGQGQRIGLFAGSGVGKSTLMSMIARNSKADVNVVALIGERGREVREFIEKDLGEDGLKKSVIVVATSDQSPMLRIKAAFSATAIAEYFRDKSMKVMLIMDSLTRFAMAQREIGLSLGEPPTAKGYTPSVFAMLPRLLERAGQSDKGSITAIYTVLVDGDDHNEPISDAVRGILDGHIVLSRELAHKNQYPAVDILFSLSRLMPDIVTQHHLSLANKIRDVMAVYRSYEDMIKIGAYNIGSNKEIDYAIEKNEKIINFIKQKINESFKMEETISLMENIFK